MCYGQQTFKPVPYSASIAYIQGITGRDLILTIHYSHELQVTHSLTPCDDDAGDTHGDGDGGIHHLHSLSPCPAEPSQPRLYRSLQPTTLLQVHEKLISQRHITFIADLISLMSLAPAKLMSTVLSPQPPTALPSDTALRLTKDS